MTEGRLLWLRWTAEANGDPVTVSLCDAAMSGDDEAMERCDSIWEPSDEEANERLQQSEWARDRF